MTQEGPGETRTGPNAARKTERPPVREYVDAGCTVFNLIPCAGEHETAVATVSELQGLLNDAG